MELFCWRLSEQIRVSLSKTQYKPPEGSNVSIKTLLQSLLPPTEPNFSEPQLRAQIRDFTLCCAALASSQTSSSSQLSWIPNSLCVAAISAFHKLSNAFSGDLDESKSTGENKLLAELLPEVLPLLKSRIKESSIDKAEDGDEISAASARVPVDYAVVAACQFRWLVMQVCGSLGNCKIRVLWSLWKWLFVLVNFVSLFTLIWERCAPWWFLVH